MPSVILSDNGVTSGSAGLKTTAASDGALALQTTTSGGTATTALTIDTSQNVGIGTTSPGYKLDVAGASGVRIAEVAAQNGFELAAGSTVITTAYNRTTNTWLALRQRALQHEFYTNGTEAMRIDSSGNVGIGTSSPNASSRATILSSGTSTSAFGNVALRLSANGSGYASTLVFSDEVANSAGISMVNGALAFGTSGYNTERMRIDSSGRLIVGLTTPYDNATFNVTSATGQTRIAAFDGGGSGARGRFFVDAPAASQINLVVDGSGTMGFVQNAVEMARFDSSRNLLVGLTSAISSFSKTIQIQDSSSSALCTSITGANARNWFTGCNSSGLYGVYDATAGAYRLQIGTTGRVYIPNAYTETTGNSANLFVDTDGRLIRATSSLKYKQNVQNATHGLTDLLKLRSVTYQGKSESDADKTFGGLIAEEVHDAGLTEFVQYAEDGSPDALAYGNMVALCVKSIQEQQALIDTQAETINALTARIVALEQA